MTKEMFDSITAWQREVFTKATPTTAIDHLREELRELFEEIFWGGWTEKAKEEYADCFLLLFGSAALYGMSYDDICDAINKKMEVNKQRKWGEPNSKGYVNHIRDES